MAIMKIIHIALYFFLPVLGNAYAIAETSSKLNSIVGEMSDSEKGSEQFTNLTKELAELLHDAISSGQIPDFDKNLLYLLIPRLIDNVETDKYAYIVLITVQNKGWSRDKAIWEKWYYETPSNEIGWITNSNSE